jgi:copper chaperone NosL
MKLKPGYLMLFASVILVFLFFLPIWSITLEAPQYPEGLGLSIYINKIDGQKEGALQSINELNHYIGMKAIIPGAIPELKIMPFFIALMILFGVITAIFKKNYLIMIWIGIFIVASAVGIYDFYKWEYDYGHNLSPKAIIKVPGMFYQPPLIGAKQLLNFRAFSMPDIGAYIAASSIITAFLSFMLNKKKVCKHIQKLQEKVAS